MSKFKSGKFEWWGVWWHFMDGKQVKEYRWRLKSANGKIVCQSEGYTTRAACLKGIKAVQAIAATSEVIETPK